MPVDGGSSTLPDGSQSMIRRCAWIVGICAAIPGFAVGLATGVAFVLMPITIIGGLTLAKWEVAIRISLALFVVLILAFVFGLGMGFGGTDWWFFAIYGASSLCALAVTFKAGMVTRWRLF